MDAPPEHSLGGSTVTGVRTRVTERRWERRVIVDAVVRHPIDAVFPYLADPTRWREFAPAAEFREQIDPGAPRVGTRWMATDRIGPFRIHFIDELESLDESRCVSWLSSAPWNARVEYACDDDDGVTRIRADYAGRLSDSLRWQVGWLPEWATHAILAQDFRRLDHLLTRRVHSAGTWRQRHAEAQRDRLSGRARVPSTPEE